MFKNPGRFLLLLAGLVAIYLAITLTNTPEAEDLAKYNLTSLQARLLTLTIVLPLVAIWFAAFYGFIRFKQYALMTGDSPEGVPLRRVANGLGILAVSLPVSAIIGALLNRMAEGSQGLVPAATIINNYLVIGLSLGAFWLIARGAYNLTRTIKQQPNVRTKRWFRVGIMALAGIYLYLTFTNPIRQFPTPEVERATYYLPDWLIVITIILPYLVIWHLGLWAAFHINFYRKHVPGKLYKPFLSYLAAGITAVIFSSIFLQFLVTYNFSLRNLGLAPILALIYVLLVAISAGYVLIALGAKRLKRIEEV